MRYIRVFKIGVRVVLAAIIAVSLHAQVITIGGPGDEAGYDIAKTADGGYIIAGETNSFGQGDFDAYIVKIDPQGNIQWTKTIGGDSADWAASVVQTSDGGYIIAGATNSFGQGDDDVYIIKLDANGNVQWSKTIGGPKEDQAHTIIQTSDGGYAIAGHTMSFGQGKEDFYVIKLDANGNLQWTKTIGNDSSDIAITIIQTSDGGYAIAGYTEDTSAIYAYIVKLDATGNIQWNKRITAGFATLGISITQTSDGGYAITGGDAIFLFAVLVSIIKLDASGNLQWMKSIGTGLDVGTSIQQTSDGGYIIAGITQASSDAPENVYVMKLDAYGNIQWTRIIGGDSSDIPQRVILTQGGYTIVGSTRSFGHGGSDIYILQLDANGNINTGNCGNVLFNAGSVTPMAGEVSFGGTANSGGIITPVSSTVNSGGNVNICVALPTETTLKPPPLKWRITNNQLWIKLPKNLPNTFIKILNIEGRTIKETMLTGNQWQPVCKLPTKGIYLLQYTSQHRIATEKILFIE